MELKNRIKATTPQWFKRIRKIGIYVSAVALALLASNSTIPGFELPFLLVTPCQWVAVAGITASAISTTAKEDNV